MYPANRPDGVVPGTAHRSCDAEQNATEHFRDMTAVRRLSDKRRPGRGVWGEPFANIASPLLK